ncbi:hypothetical protein WJX74_009277 [Apatococcus lobatus]|uniref:Histidine decarboxylase n=1 Tax=Apatococcus lobatus TaxID=904363 RepID=A0AAW1RRS1_9CHLO
MTDPFALASALPVPIAVERRDSSRSLGQNGSLANGESGELLGSSPTGRSPSRRLQRMSSSLREQLDVKGPVAPYQALPVQGPIEDAPAANLPIMEPNGMPAEEFEARINKVLADYKQKLAERTSHHMGYPYNLDFEYGALDGLQKFSINNLGDPFIASNYGVHSREFEVGVLHWFARLWEIDQDEYWGYITNCGTEGNLHGILVGRENLPDGVLYASKDSHYSVFKAARMYRMQAVQVATLKTGEIDCADLKVHLLRNKGKPAILNVNIGTTVKGAVDDLDQVLDILKETGYTEDRFFIHCDGALFGLMVPFVKRAPLVTFEKPIGSVSVSGHKFVGAPVPCGVVITRTRYVEALANSIEYLNSRDATIMGSRNGHAPIYLWYTLTRKGYEGMRQDVERCLLNAHLLKAMLSWLGIKTMLNELSSTVVFERPTSEIFVRKWQLACQGDIAHVVVMPNITITKVLEFVQDLILQRRGCSEETARRAAKEALDFAEAHVQSLD